MKGRPNVKIEVEERDVYGLTKVYVTNEPARTSIEMLTGRKCLRRTDVEALQALGHEVVRPAKVERRYEASANGSSSTTSHHVEDMA